MPEVNQSHQSQVDALHTNRLISETSPYLLQHAHNPVNWYPWSDEALLTAQREDKPILLSVGYSACHWCHVMERESFENEQIAAIMNQYFISIKVDREERPDIDSIYMQALQGMTGQGGWPMTMFLTPDGKPFEGGTYFPPQDRSYGRGTLMPGFASVLRYVAQSYREHRQEIEERASQIAEYLRERSTTPLRRKVRLTSDQAPELSLLVGAANTLEEVFDRIDGGFGGGPKFPNTMALNSCCVSTSIVPSMTFHLHLRPTNQANWRW